MWSVIGHRHPNTETDKEPPGLGHISILRPLGQVRGGCACAESARCGDPTGWTQHDSTCSTNTRFYNRETESEKERARASERGGGGGREREREMHHTLAVNSAALRRPDPWSRTHSATPSSASLPHSRPGELTTSPCLLPLLLLSPPLPPLTPRPPRTLASPVL